MISEKKFHELIRKMYDNMGVLSNFNQMFIELYIRAPKEKRLKLFKALPETINTIIKTFQCMNEDDYLEMQKNVFPDQAVINSIKKSEK